ncbi:MAG: S8 family serine peptidase, partial [Clostridia bacterium]|nr:S8 family serine peptidase [Clostridia bacterium]
VCVMDTGISPHTDLSLPRERIVHFEYMINEENEPYDDNGHGTFVTGVICGNGILSGGRIKGIAPRANVVGIKVIGESGESGTFKILDGMQWLFDNYRQYGIKVVCMSFGADPLSYADPLKMGAEMLARSGLIVVAASGNSGENALKSPAISNEIISVGAVDSDGRIAPFTSRGVYQGALRPDVFADGVDVKGIAAGGTYSTMTGTSASAPYVAGACSLLCQKYRNITPRQAKHAIVSSSQTVDGNRIFKL